MYSRKKIPAPFGKPQKTAEKKKEATTAFSQKETSKEPIFLHAEEKTMPQGGGSSCRSLVSRSSPPITRRSSISRTTRYSSF